MPKIDLTKTYKTYFSAKTKPELVVVEEARFVSIRGKGDPSGKEFTEKIQMLYPVAYAIKFEKKGKGKDFVVSKLEGQWWYDEKKFPNLNISTSTEVPRSEWEYRLLIRLPDFVTKKDVANAIEKCIQEKGLTKVKEIEYFIMAEGKCVQMLHVGPFSTEPETLLKMQDFMKENNFSRNGLHHEIYLSDFRKVVPAKRKTILREPVK